MHVNETEFFKRAKDMYTLSFSAAQSDLSVIAQFIEEVRDINNLDPNFIYTCLQEQPYSITWWLFAYSNEDICNKAYELGKLYIPQEAEERLLLDTTEISCPFMR